MDLTLDICIPVVAPRSHLENCIDHLEHNTDPFYEPTNRQHGRRYIFCDDAGDKSILEYLRWLAREKDGPMVVIRNEERLYYTRTVNRCLARSTAKFVAVVHPSIIIQDDQWMWKMAQPLLRDSMASASMVYTDREWAQQDPSPLKRTDLVPAKELFMVRRDTLKGYGPLPDENLDDPMGRYCENLRPSSRVWVVPSIKISMFESLATVVPEEARRRGKAESTVIVDRAS